MTRPLSASSPTPFPANPDAGGVPARQAAPPQASPPKIAAKPARKGHSLAWVYLAITALLAGTIAGSSYYFAPLSDRVRSPLHSWLRPSGYIGQSAGILAFVIFIFLWLYPLRKKYRWLGWTGVMSKWLDSHVSVALVVPFITAIHATWRFGGVIGLGFWSMIVVCASGIVGRYLYVHIPRRADGLELTAEEIAAERRELMGELATASGLAGPQVEALLRSDPSPMAGAGLLKTLQLMLRDDLDRRKAARSLKRMVANRPGAKLDRKALANVLHLANREMALTQQARMLEAIHEVFRFWHVAHRPFAIAALAAVTLHVVVVVFMGMTWFW